MADTLFEGKYHKVPFFSYTLPERMKIGSATLLIGEEINRNFQRACFAEFLALHFFVLISCGCAMVVLAETNPPPNLMEVAAAFGFCILGLAQFVGPLSGGHINCAVSFGLFIGGRCSLIRAVCYTLSQMAGSVLGALWLWAIFGNNWPAARAFGSNSWDPLQFTGGQVFLGEMMGTMLLVYCVFATIDIPTEGGGPLGVFPIAMAVMVCHLLLLPIDGCSINPTRSFGPSLVAAIAGISGNYYSQQYMFWFAPMFGAGLAAYIYEYAALKQKKRAAIKEDMTDTIFMANKSRTTGAGDGTSNGYDSSESTEVMNVMIINSNTNQNNSNNCHDHHDHGHDHSHNHSHSHDHTNNNNTIISSTNHNTVTTSQQQQEDYENLL